MSRFPTQKAPKQKATTPAKVKTRASDARMLLSVTPGPEHLTITGVRLPTYQQVLLSLLANIDFERAQDASKQAKASQLSAKTAVLEVKQHYGKGHVPLIQDHKPAKDCSTRSR